MATIINQWIANSFFPTIPIYNYRSILIRKWHYYSSVTWKLIIDQWPLTIFLSRKEKHTESIYLFHVKDIKKPSKWAKCSKQCFLRIVLALSIYTIHSFIQQSRINTRLLPGHRIYVIDWIRIEFKLTYHSYTVDQYGCWVVHTSTSPAPNLIVPTLRQEKKHLAMSCIGSSFRL